MSTTVEKEILGLQEAEKEVMKTVEKLGMLSLLIAGNILRKDKEGDIIYLNPGMESTLLTKVSVEPDELDTLTLEELIAEESDILCSVAEENEHSFTYALTDIAASSTQRPGVEQTADQPENEDFDDDDPSNCHFFHSGTCKYTDISFKALAKTYWLGCEYPGCDKWFHDSCLLD